MTEKRRNIIYIIVTNLLSLMMLATIGNSIFNSEFTKRFVEIGYPTYLIIPLMTAKGLGIIAIWSNKSHLLKEWAYSGFFFLFLLAMLAEINAPFPDYVSPPTALILLLASYLLWKKKID
ncbi:MAG: DoxX family protein [Flavobacteriales bacterium]|nr:DoxX family protein [Flavobacteriales bacterium]